MDIRQLRHVLAIHRSGSFARAAVELGLAQSTLSKSVARLEDRLGLKLFERTGVGAEATPLGLMICARAERLIDETERLQRDVELSAAGDAGEVRIGVGPALRPEFLPRFAEMMVRRWPRLKISIDVEGRDRLIIDFKAGRYDVILTAGGVELDGPEYIHVEIMCEPLFALVSPGHPLAGRAVIGLDEFVRHPHAAAGARSLLVSPGAQFDERPAAPIEPQIQCTDDATLLALARAGLATVLFPRHMVAADLDAGQLVVLPLRWNRSVRFIATTTRAAYRSPIIEEVLKMTRVVWSE